MTKIVSAVTAATGLFGLFISLTIATPSNAQVSASALLAAKTGPMLALDAAALADDQTSLAAPATPRAAPPSPATLAALVETHETTDIADAEQLCLAASIYHEAKGEPLAGQLAVAETVLNRAASGRFPTSLCGVIRQPGQFSFVRGGRMPAVPRDSKAWRQAVAVARIAQAEMWQDVAPAALYFHASRVAPRWGGAKRIAQLGNHVFYR